MKIAMVGDVMLGRIVNDQLKHLDKSYPWGDTLPIFHDADLRMCNLECVLSDVGRPWSATEKVFHFRSDEKNVSSLMAANIDIVTIANNHVLDFEYDALSRMLQVLDDKHILHAGAGRSLSEAMRPALCEVKGERIAVVAFTDNERDWEAKDGMPGIYYVPIKVGDQRAQGLFRDIERLRKQVDFLIVSAHWGGNWGYTPQEEHVSFAHALVDAGANVIFGHSCHVFRGIEVYKSSPIIYSAGDFIDDYAVDEVERNDESFIFVVERTAGRPMQVLLYPTCIHNFQAVMASTHRREVIFNKMEHHCKKMGTTIEWYADHAVVKCP